MQPLTVIFIGPQGSGKGTQIARLRERLSSSDPTRRIIDIQTGRRFRALAAKEENYTERHIAETIDTGVLQPLFLSVVLWGEEFLHHVDPECHLLIDGFPRTEAEAVVLESALSFYNRAPLSIVFLDTPEDVVRNRMRVRARKDDTPEAIEERLRWYKAETLSVVEYYSKRPDTRMVHIEGTKGIDEVHAEIIAALDILHAD